MEKNDAKLACRPHTIKYAQEMDTMTSTYSNDTEAKAEVPTAPTKVRAKISLSDMLSSLPSAEEMQECTAQAQEARQAREDARKDHDDRIREYMHSYLIHGIAGLGPSLEQARVKGHSWVVFLEARAPPPAGLKSEMDPAQVSESYWAGVDEDGNALDASEKGVPKVLLMQGPMHHRPGAKGTANPKLLPDGLTLGDRLQAEFVKSNHTYAVRTVYDRASRMVKVMVISDLKKWDSYQAHLAEKAKSFKAGRGPRSRGPVDDE